MRKGNRKFNRAAAMWIGTLSLLLTVSCESVLFIELEESDKLIVVNGALSKDSIVSIQVSRTRHILDNADIAPLEGATVNLYRSGAMLEQLNHSGNGYFSSTSIRPGVGEAYMIEVENPGYETVSASVEIPPSVLIASVDTSTVIQEYGDIYYSYTTEIFQMDVTINDPPAVENYYLLNMEVNSSYTQWRDTTVQYVDSLFHNGEWHYFVSDSTYTTTDTIRFTDQPYIGSSDLIVEANTRNGILFSDQLIDGKEYSIRAITNLQSLRSADSALCLRFAGQPHPWLREASGRDDRALGEASRV